MIICHKLFPSSAFLEITFFISQLAHLTPLYVPFLYPLCITTPPIIHINLLVVLR